MVMFSSLDWGSPPSGPNVRSFNSEYKTHRDCRRFFRECIPPWLEDNFHYFPFKMVPFQETCKIFAGVVIIFFQNIGLIRKKTAHSMGLVYLVTKVVVVLEINVGKPTSSHFSRVA